MAGKVLLPDDFRQVAEAMKCRIALMAHYRVSLTTINRWISRTGAKLPSRYGTPMPADLAEQAGKMHLAALTRHYGVGEKVVGRWLALAGISASKPAREANPRFRPTPLDFREQAGRLTLTGLRYHYDVAPETIKRWCSETGVRPQKPIRIPPLPPKPRKGVVHAMGVSSNISASRRASTVHDIAADTLRRERFPVYRCDERGRADIAGSFWRVGMTVLDDDQLLAKAARYERRAA